MYLPLETWAIILEWLPFEDWFTTSLVCHDWNRVMALYTPYLNYTLLELSESRNRFAMYLFRLRLRALQKVSTLAAAGAIVDYYTVLHRQISVPITYIDIGNTRIARYFPHVFTVESSQPFRKCSVAMTGTEILRWEGQPSHRKVFDIRILGHETVFQTDWFHWATIHLNIDLPDGSMVGLRHLLPTIYTCFGKPFKAHITRLCRPLSLHRPVICVVPTEPDKSRIVYQSTTQWIDNQSRPPDLVVDLKLLLRFATDNSTFADEVPIGDNVWYAFSCEKPVPDTWLETAEKVLRMQRRPAILRSCGIRDWFCSHGYLIHSSMIAGFAATLLWNERSERPTITYDLD
jgi:F-box-like